jgi:translation elongation factor EF-Tu-like GTPase
MSKTKFERTKPHVNIDTQKAMDAGWAAPQNHRKRPLVAAIQLAILRMFAKDRAESQGP